MSSSSLEAPFAVGHTSEVYSWDEGTILKLFREWFPMNAIEHEAHVARVVHSAGLPAPGIVGDIIEVGGGPGIVYERVTGISMLETLSSQRYSHMSTRNYHKCYGGSTSYTANRSSSPLKNSL